jgi:hypothetical protein
MVATIVLLMVVVVAGVALVGIARSGGGGD